LSPLDSASPDFLQTLEPEASERSRFLFFQVMAEFWRDAASAEPLVLLIDDLHRDGSASMQLLSTVADVASIAPLLLAAAYRQEEVRASHSLRETLATLVGRSHVRHLAIDGLSESESKRLLSVLTGSDPEPRVWQAITERCEGNPLFLREVAREVVRGGMREQRDSGFPAPALPESIRLLFERRLDRLDPATRRLLEVASVVGRRFDQETIAAVQADVAAKTIAASLEKASEARLITPLPDLGWYQFIHELLRETVYETISAPRRMACHRAVGTWIERRHARDLDLHLSRLAHHFTLAALDGRKRKGDRIPRARCPSCREAFLARGGGKPLSGSCPPRPRKRGHACVRPAACARPRRDPHGCPRGRRADLPDRPRDGALVR
jgi:predicted ATPase